LLGLLEQLALFVVNMVLDGFLEQLQTWRPILGIRGRRIELNQKFLRDPVLLKCLQDDVTGLLSIPQGTPLACSCESTRVNNTNLKKLITDDVSNDPAPPGQREVHPIQGLEFYTLAKGRPRARAPP